MNLNIILRQGNASANNITLHQASVLFSVSVVESTNAIEQSLIGVYTLPSLVGGICNIQTFMLRR